ncbi:MFS general substrate transporter [Hypoxylon rubiginosum]|uniref:MFS general substrate transporter n=1 Tax=Hypoxylon rubiginosum TaxID=110542 RepID=A0ACC0DBB9_9PEZI|nr:MFS general substrate transporter [Hypoxylon rubiginosum]
MLNKRLPGFLRRTVTDDAAVEPADVIQVTNQRKDEEHVPATDGEKPAEELPTGDAQDGVKAIEAITLSWSKGSLVAVYVCMWSIYFVNAFQSSTTSNLTAYVVSGFDQHSLIPVISIVSSAMCAACTMPVAKILNLFDRSKGFLAMGVLATIGLILMATCTNIAVYCAAQVFYNVGFTSLIYTIDVMTADTSKLSHRGLAFAFTSSPYIITAFAGPKAAEKFYADNWRWAFGCWAIILPFVVLSLFFVLQGNLRKAKKAGKLQHVPSGRTFMQSVWFYVIEFDLLGVVLLAGGLVIFLLPFSLADSMGDSWRSPTIIVMLVIGFAMIVAFALVERFVAPKPFLPYGLLVSRTVIGSCLLDFTYMIAYYCWNSYFSSYLQVVYDLDISTAGYIGGIFDIVSATWLLGTGYLMRRTGRFRWLLQIAVPLYILFVGLLIYFRKPGTNIGFIVMCEILIALAGGTMIIGEQVGVMAASDHNDVAAVLALLSLFGNTGSAVGNSISGAIWTNTLPNSLQRLLPDDAKADWEDIYDSLDVQLSYPMGSDVRSAIIEAYAQTQTYMIIAGTVIMSLSLIWVMLIKNIRLNEIQQTKGVLF